MIQPKPRFILTEDEKESRLWKRLCEHWQDRLQTLRAQNDSDKSESATARLRGQIAELKASLGLEKELPETD